jgi:hypothetical protein
MSSVFCIVDDKHIPLYRVMWVSNLPHFCGNEDCDVEGRYEIRLEPDDSVFGSREERDAVLKAIEMWQAGAEPDDDWEQEP